MQLAINCDPCSNAGCQQTLWECCINSVDDSLVTAHFMTTLHC